MPRPKFTNKQLMFIQEYLVDYNARQACIRAGYNPNTATVMGYENLTKPHIRKAIDDQIKLIVEKSQDKVAYVLNSLMEVSRIVDQEKLQHKVKSLELLGKYMSMWSDKVEISGDKDAPLNIVFEGVLPGDERIETDISQP